MKEVPEKIIEKVRKLLLLKESAAQVGSEGEAHAAAAAVHRLLVEYNLSLLDIGEVNPQSRLTVCESDRISYKDAAGNIWKRDLMRVLCEHNYCKMLLYTGTTHMVVIGTEENAATVIALFDYLRKTFRRLSEEKYSEYAQGRLGYWRTGKGKKNYIRSYLEGCIPGLRIQLEKIVQTPQETGLIVCHQKLISDYMTGIKLVKRKPVALKHKTNYEAYMTGVDDGSHISLNRQLKDNTLF